MKNLVIARQTGGGQTGFLSAKGFADSVRLSGFTLAEVLITLGIIGVVAAMTLPVLIHKLNDRANVSGMKKAYSILSQATLSVAAENPIDSWNMQTADIEGTKMFLNFISHTLR